MDLIALFFLYYLVGVCTFQLAQTYLKSVSTEALLVGMTISLAGLVGLMILIFSSSLPTVTAYRVVLGVIIAIISGDIATLSILRVREPFKIRE